MEKTFSALLSALSEETDKHEKATNDAYIRDSAWLTSAMGEVWAMVNSNSDDTSGLGQKVSKTAVR